MSSLGRGLRDAAEAVDAALIRRRQIRADTTGPGKAAKAEAVRERFARDHPGEPYLPSETAGT